MHRAFHHRPLPRRARFAAAVGLAGLLLVAPALLCQLPGEARLSAYWSEWERQTGLLMTAAERRAFAALADDIERERFAAAFWRVRGEAAAARWRSHRAAAGLLRSLAPARTHAVLLAGKPVVMESYRGCDALRPLEVWRWEAWQFHRDRRESGRPATVLFYQASALDGRSYRPFAPPDLAPLLRRGLEGDLAAVMEKLVESGCFDARRRERLAAALGGAIGFEELRRRLDWPSPEPDWLARWEGQLEPAAPLLWPDAELEWSALGAFHRYTIVRLRLRVRPRRLRELAPGRLLDRVVMMGDVYRRGRLVDSFEITHHLAGSRPSGRVELDAFRRLEPGPHELRLRAVDGADRALWAGTLSFEVPASEAPAPPPAGSARGYSHLTRDEIVVLDTFPSVELRTEPGKAAASTRVEALTAGGPIAAVEFRFEGEPARVDASPPFEQEVELTDEPRRVTVAALDPGGRELARDEGRIRRRSLTGLRFGEVRADGRVEVNVGLPEGVTLRRLECLHGRRIVEVASGPELSCPLPAPAAGRSDYLAAVATLSSGGRLEDVLYLGSGASEEVDVRLVELYVTAFDDRGHPVVDLERNEFRVTVGGEEQPLERASGVAGLPLNVALLMDISSSMGRRLAVVTEGARNFFEETLGGRDLAALLAFNHDLHRLVGFTASRERLRLGATGLSAWGSTRLHDAVVYALFQFSGLGSRRALIVLSDGEDVESDFPFAQVLRLARPAGVAVYTVSLGAESEASAANLARLAGETGGRAFRVRSVDDLEGVYRRIEAELRSQYLLVVRPLTPATEMTALRVEVLRPGVSSRGVRPGRR